MDEERSEGEAVESMEVEGGEVEEDEGAEKEGGGAEEKGAEVEEGEGERMESVDDKEPPVTENEEREASPGSSPKGGDKDVYSPPNPETGEPPGSARDVFQKQVAAFKTKQELEQFTHTVRLTRTALADLKPDTALTNIYAGGKVIGMFSGDLTQGRVVILLQDDPHSDRYLQCLLDGDITRLLPSSTLLGMSEVYLHGGWVGKTIAESSQEMELELRVESEEGKVWIVNREAENDGFLPARDPKDFQGRGAAGKKARRQRHMEAGLERERREKEGGVVSETPAAAAASGRTEESKQQKDETSSNPVDPSSHPPAATTSVQLASKSSETSAPNNTGPEPQPSVIPSTFPDHCDIPDSVLGAHSIARDNTNNQSGAGARDDNDQSGAGAGESEEDSSSSESSETSSESEGEEEEGERGGQDATLFSYQQSSSSHRQYTYKKISDLEPGMQKVNVFGVVSDFQPPFQTKGRDMCSIVNITDESTPDNPFKCTFFHSNQEKLPQVKKVGDIVCFHRINIKLFPKGVQGIGQTFSSSLSFTGRLGAKVKPVTGSVSYTFTARDKQRVRELRLWSARQRRPNNPFARALKDVTPGAPTDLVCQILSVSLTEPVSECSVGVLRVWDGTKMPQRRLDLDLSGFTTVAADSQLLESAEVFSESVVVYGRELVKKVVALLPAQFVCLQNLRAKTHTHRNAFRDHVTALELRLQPSPGSARETTIRVLTSDDIAVSELKRSLKDALKVPVKFRSLPPDVVPSPITHITHSNQEALPLSAVAKLSQQEQIPLKFRCIVKVLGITPQSVEELVRLRCPACRHKISITTNTQNETPCPKCSNSSSKDGRKKKSQLMDPTYFFKLQLVDETGNLIVYASGQQAANFLSGFPPAVFFRQPQQRMSLLERLYTVTGGNDPFDADSVAFTRPWVEICLVCMSSAVGGRSVSGRGQTTYHLFDTELTS